jgi:serine-type D-Ala-D-Ala carboxypeptidase (penicillin-binding protein 5/6)
MLVLMRSLLLLASTVSGLFMTSCAAQPQPAVSTTRYVPEYRTAGEMGYTAQPALATPDLMASSSVQQAATGAPAIRAASYILVDAVTGVPLDAHNADTRRAVASTQKLLTALCVLDAGNLGKSVRIQASDVQVETTRLSQYGMRVGDVYTRKQLLTVFLVKSANDVAKALARDVAGSQDAFADRMNAKARQLGMRSSHFVNAHGLTEPGQYSTARDMARLALVAYRSPFIRETVRQKYLRFRFSSGKTVTLENTNDLLGDMPECNGMKTGYTNASGRCLISSAATRSRAVILVQLGTKTKFIWDDGRLLMSWGLRR